MRLLASFILTCCLLFTQRDAEAKAGAQDIKSVGAAKVFGDVIIFHHAELRQGNNSQRHHGGPAAVQFENDWSQPEIFLSSIHFKPSYSYCQTIGQKLLYPKHYFW